MKVNRRLLALVGVVVLASFSGYVTAQLSDLARIEQAQAFMRELEPRLTKSGVTNARNIYTRLETLKGQLLPVEPVPVPVDCVLSDWTLASAGAWGACSPEGTQTRSEVWTRTVIIEPANGGEACGALSETRIVTQSCVPPEPIPGPPPSTERNAYFEALIARPDHWKSYSLRDQAQLLAYKAARSLPPDVNYLYPNDSDPRQQDAAKLVIPDFYVTNAESVLQAPLSATATTFAIPRGLPARVRLAYQIDNEILKYVSHADNVVTVVRGQHGTKATDHAAGAVIKTSTNSLPNQVWLPMGTEDGHSYLTTWDAWYGREVLPANTGLTNWKTYQFRKGEQSPSLAFEVRTRFDGGSSPWKLTLDPATDIGSVDMRTYLGTVGPTVTRQEPISPMVGTFRVTAETWTRYWMLIEQRAGDWDLVSLWVADERTAPVQILDRIPVEVGTTTPTIHSFQLEFNTSTDVLKEHRGPLTVYVRNVVMLRDVRDATNLFQKPVR